MRKFTIFLIMALFIFMHSNAQNKSVTNSSDGTISSNSKASELYGLSTLISMLSEEFKDLFVPGNENVTENSLEFPIKNMKVYPNPVSDVLNVELPDGLFKVSLLNKLGKKLFSYDYNGQTHIKIQAMGYNPDVYFLHIYSVNTGDLRKKIIVFRE